MDKLGGENGVDARAVLCIDDNEWIGESLMRMLRREEGFVWKGWLPSEDGIWEKLAESPHAVVLLDIDVPGQDSFMLVERIAARCPQARVLMLSGHVQPQLVDRAIAAGAWGYVSKNEETSAILEALRQVAAGRVAFSPSVRDHFQRQP